MFSSVDLPQPVTDEADEFTLVDCEVTIKNSVETGRSGINLGDALNHEEGIAVDCWFY